LFSPLGLPFHDIFRVNPRDAITGKHFLFIPVSINDVTGAQECDVKTALVASNVELLMACVRARVCVVKILKCVHKF
jgi:hypothetical protein